MYEIRPESIRTFIDDRSIKLPRFQRKQTWDEKANFKLCISLFKEYPLGVCILNVEKEKEQTTKWLLDGRQRRNALNQFFLDPEKVYEWAKRFVKFKRNCQIQELEDKYWAAINEYLEDDELAENDESELNEVGILSYSSLTEMNADESESTGLELLLKIITLVHTKESNISGFTRPFDFTKLTKSLPYVDYSSGRAKLNSRKIRSFIGSFKVYCRDNGCDYLVKESFVQYFYERFSVSVEDRPNVSSTISQKWNNILDRIQILDRIDDILINAKIGIIEVKDLSPVDAQKIFNIINTGGTKLSAVEVLSAKPSWNRVVENPSQEMVSTTRKLYEELGTIVPDNVVMWDLPATTMRRLDNSTVFFKKFTSSKTEFSKELTIGFKLLSGMFQGGITKDDVDRLSKKANSEWASTYESSISDLNIMTKIVLEHGYFKYFKTWRKPIIDLLSNACALNFFLLLVKDWERKGRPIGNNIDTAMFQKNAFIIFDRMIYEYTMREWRGSSDSKIASNLSSISNSTNVLPPVQQEKWLTLIDEIFESNEINGAEITSTAAVVPMLYHAYCLNTQSGPDTEYTIEVDHIIPRAIFELTALSNKNIQHNLFNLGLLPKDENASKNKKQLSQIMSPWLIDQIEKYEFIPREDFGKYSDTRNLDQLKDLRKSVFSNIFSEQRDKLICN